MRERPDDRVSLERLQIEGRGSRHMTRRRHGDDVELVINYDFPLALEDYIHRSGRTGRAGKTGRCVSLVAPMEKRLYEVVKAHMSGKEVTNAPKAPGRGYGMPKRREGGGGRGRSGGREGGRSGGGGGGRGRGGRGRTTAGAV